MTAPGRKHISNPSSDKTPSTCDYYFLIDADKFGRRSGNPGDPESDGNLRARCIRGTELGTVHSNTISISIFPAKTTMFKNDLLFSNVVPKPKTTNGETPPSFAARSVRANRGGHSNTTSC